MSPYVRDAHQEAACWCRNVLHAMSVLLAPQYRHHRPGLGFALTTAAKAVGEGVSRRRPLPRSQAPQRTALTLRSSSSGRPARSNTTASRTSLSGQYCGRRVEPSSAPCKDWLEKARLGRRHRRATGRRRVREQRWPTSWPGLASPHRELGRPHTGCVVIIGHPPCVRRTPARTMPQASMSHTWIATYPRPKPDDTDESSGACSTTT